MTDMIQRSIDWLVKDRDSPPVHGACCAGNHSGMNLRETPTAELRRMLADTERLVGAASDAARRLRRELERREGEARDLEPVLMREVSALRAAAMEAADELEAYDPGAVAQEESSIGHAVRTLRAALAAERGSHDDRNPTL